ncbi:MAG: glycosyltransferase family 4 protein [Candidatus Xiphinematobacter sp.]|nr:MAG: glycosyltransferase family 4 protein [Candidatus Xiphinematobacter sp.]QQY10668.1 MAG: glycosyltransferase family 4 protein [Candidatus Xiphinematobacter sp.]QQY11410.1 MAG: glycosyltransferase family 4 protein [Candidatus Xiphinematobacter sp.]
MRIALARRGYSSTGGAEAYLSRLAQGLVENGEEVVLYSSNEWPVRAWPYGKIRCISGDTPLRFARALHTQKRDFDCLLSLERVLRCDVYRAGDGVHASWLCRRRKFEPAWKAWFRSLNSKHREILKLERFAFNPCCTALVITNSRMVLEEILRYYNFPRERIMLIPNGVWPQPVSSKDRMYIRSRYGLSSKEIVVLFAGTGWQRKGLRFAVEAVRALRGQAKLLVVGQGPSRHTPPHTIFAGPASCITPFYAAADVFLLPTVYDPSSNACLEALASGLPVITTPSNGFSELLGNEELGNVVEVGNVGSLTAALERWLPQEKRATGRRARVEAAAAFSVEKNVQRTLDAIKTTVGL